MKMISDLPILDRDGTETPFHKLWETDGNQQQPKTVLVIFIRHFFCGNCQEYITHLSLNLSHNLPIVVIGCGAPSLIASYTDITNCPWPIYADPSQRIFSALGMTRTLSLGNKGTPEYMQRTPMTTLMWRSMKQEFGHMWSGEWKQGGDWFQVGGEFLLQEVPPADGKTKKKGNVEVKWCHRMESTRDHAEVNVLKEVLGLEAPIKEEAEESPAPIAEDAQDTTTKQKEEEPASRPPPPTKRLSWIQRTRRSISLRRDRSRSTSISTSAEPNSRQQSHSRTRRGRRHENNSNHNPPAEEEQKRQSALTAASAEDGDLDRASAAGRSTPGTSLEIDGIAEGPEEEARGILSGKK